MTQEFESYANTYDVFMTGQQRYQDMLEFHRQSMQGSHKVIDAGAGTGNLTKVLLDDNHEVLAFDPNQDSLDILTEKIGQDSRLTVANADSAEGLANADSYDGAVSSIVIPFPTDIPRYLKSISDALHSGAPFSLSVWAPVESREDKIWGSILAPIMEFWKSGYLQEHWEEIGAVLAMGDENERLVLEKNVNLSVLKGLLGEAGFGNIKVVEDHPYEHYQYWITCQKQ